MLDKRSIVRELFDNDWTTEWSAAETDISLVWNCYWKGLALSMKGLGHASTFGLREVENLFAWCVQQKYQLLFD
ncbi:hypothetical protein D3C79_1042550 [compost metagenome]